MLRFRLLLFFFKQKTAYEMRISDWSSDVCSSDLGAAAAAAAAETARKTFEEGATGDALPRHTVPGGEIGVVDALVALGFAASKGEARRLIKGGGARLDGEKVADEAAVIRLGDQPVRLSAGKKHHGLLTR